MKPLVACVLPRRMRLLLGRRRLLNRRHPLRSTVTRLGGTRTLSLRGANSTQHAADDGSQRNPRTLSRLVTRHHSCCLPVNSGHIPQRHLSAIRASRSARRATLLARAASLIEFKAGARITLGVSTDASHHSRNTGTGDATDGVRNTPTRDAKPELRTQRTDPDELNSGEDAADRRNATDAPNAGGRNSRITSSRYRQTQNQTHTLAKPTQGTQIQGTHTELSNCDPRGERVAPGTFRVADTRRATQTELLLVLAVPGVRMFTLCSGRDPINSRF